MLLTPPTALAKYDIPMPVLDVLRSSAVRHVSIIGRRGPLQAAFTTKELRELTTLDGTSMLPLAPELLSAPTPYAKLTRTQSRLLRLLQQQQQQQRGTSSPYPGPSRTKTWSLDFFRSHTALAMEAPASNRPRPWLALTLAHTALDASARAVPTGVTPVQHTDLVVAALGHQGGPRRGVHRSLTRTPAHRARRAGAQRHKPHAVPRLRVWVGRDGRARLDAYAVTDTILADYHFGDGCADAREGLAAEYSEDALVADGVVDLESVAGEVEEGVRARRVVQYEQWKNVDAEEVRRGAGMDKERERIGWEEAHDFLTSTGAWLSP